MSFRNTLNESINTIILDYNKTIAKQFNLDLDKLNKLWGDREQTTNVKESDNGVETPKQTESKPEPLSAAKLMKCNKPELKKLCKDRGLKLTGTKAVLLQRLLGNKEAETVPKKKETKSTTKNNQKTPKIIKKLQTNISTMVIRRNAHGNLEHSESSLVFDRKTKKVIGKQSDDGSILPITKEDINICNKYKFDYILPENLDVNKGLDDVKVEELEDEEIEDEEELEEVEEELASDEEIVEEEELEEDEEIVEEEEELASDEEFEYYEEEV